MDAETSGALQKLFFLLKSNLNGNKQFLLGDDFVKPLSGGWV